MTLLFVSLATISSAIACGCVVVLIANLVDNLVTNSVNKREKREIIKEIINCARQSSMKHPYSFETGEETDYSEEDALLTEIFNLVEDIEEYDLVELRLVERQVKDKIRKRGVILRQG